MVIRPNFRGFFPKLPHGFVGPVALGNGTQYVIGLIFVGRAVYVGVEDRGFAKFIGRIIPQQSMSLGITNWSDVCNMSDFINSQLEHENFAPLGYYKEELCEQENTRLGKLSGDTNENRSTGLDKDAGRELAGTHSVPTGP